MAEGNSFAIHATSKPGYTSGGTLDPYKRLAAAVIAQAAQAAREGDQDAAIWLLSEQAEFLADAVGLSCRHVQAWAAARLALTRTGFTGSPQSR